MATRVFGDTGQACVSQVRVDEMRDVQEVEVLLNGTDWMVTSFGVDIDDLQVVGCVVRLTRHSGLATLRTIAAEVSHA